MKVIGVDNFDRDYVPQKQITLSLSEETAKAIADLLNKGGGNIYYRVVDDDYKLNYEDMHDVVGEKMTFNSYQTVLFHQCTLPKKLFVSFATGV